MLNNKKQIPNGGSSPTTQPKKRLSLSNRLLNLTSEYVEDEEIRDSMIESYKKFRPKSYGEVNHSLYKISTRSVIPLHVLSFVICMPFFCIIFFLVATAIFPSVTILHYAVPLVVSCIIVAMLEAWQHVTLESLFYNYYQNGKKLNSFLFIVSMIFCSISVGLGLFGLDILTMFVDVPILILRYSMGLVAIALLVETMILFATWYTSHYQFSTTKGIQAQNDLYKGFDYLGLDMKNVNPTITTKPDNLTRAKKKKKRKKAPAAPHQAPSNQDVNLIDLIKGKNTQNNSTGTAAILIQEKKKPEPQKNIVRTKEPVKNTKRKNTTKKQVYFTEKELEHYLKTYSGRARTRATAKARRTNQMKASYICFTLSHFEAKQVNGVVKFSIDDAEKWYKNVGGSVQEHYDQKSQRAIK